MNQNPINNSQHKKFQNVSSNCIPQQCGFSAKDAEIAAESVGHEIGKGLLKPFLKSFFTRTR